MKIKTKSQGAWVSDWDGFPDKWDGYCGGYDIHDAPRYRVSELLGPDGEPLMVGIERPKMGFDLRRKE